MVTKYASAGGGGGILQIGETHIPMYCTTATSCDTGTKDGNSNEIYFQVGETCFGEAAGDAWQSFLGLRQSAAAAAGAVVRPFVYINAPPSCFPFYPYPVSVTNGYNKNQP